MYKITKEIKEPTLLTIQSLSDDRGLLIPISDDIDSELFQRSYIVENYGKGVIRGLHYHKKEMKIFTMGCGAAKFITMKLPEDIADRNNNEEIKEYINKNPNSIKTFVLSSRHHGVLIIPTYYANGWIGLEEHCVLFAFGSVRWEIAKDDDIRIDPLVIGDDYWLVKPR